MIKAILFDLDGTLLPMDQDAFIKHYFGLLAAKLAPLGYDSRQLINAIWTGTAAMVKNTGETTNETVFWRAFCQIFGEQALADEPVFDEYYRTDFQAVRSSCGFAPEAAQTIRLVRAKGLRPVLATNPVFPAVATQSRIRWAGLQPEDFELYTTYENSSYCKPNPQYYAQILRKLDLKPEECIMVGNDATEDLAAEALGIQVFLLTDCLINKEQKDISAYPQGGFPQLMEFIAGLNG